MPDPTPHDPNDARAAEPLSLARLYERFDALLAGPPDDETVGLHAAILARLAANRRRAEAAGWSDFALQRDEASGRIRLVGVAPEATAPTLVPDWTTRVAADALARRDPGHRTYR